MTKTKILIASAQGIVRLGLKTLLTRAKNCIVVGEADNPTAILDSISQHAPEILLLDAADPGIDAIELVKTLKNSPRTIRVLILTDDDSEESFLTAFHAGADGYLLKNADPQHILDALTTLRGGELFFGPHISELMLKRFLAKPQKATSSENSLPANLTKREVEVLRLIALGLTNPEIAEKLFISPHTVHAHRTNLLRKLNAQGTAQLVHFAIEFGLVPSKSET